MLRGQQDIPASSERIVASYSAEPVAVTVEVAVDV